MRFSFLLFLFFIISCNQPDINYMGQKKPGTIPELFAPGIVNTEAVELNGVFTPDYSEFIFTRLDNGTHTLYHSILTNGSWSHPEPLLLFPDSARALSADPFVSPDGNFLYFVGIYPNEYFPENTGLDIWVSHRSSGQWQTAKVLSPPINTAYLEVYPVIISDGSLYFSSNRPDGEGLSDVYRAQRMMDGNFQEPIGLGPRFNTQNAEEYAFIAPDESYLVFASSRPGGHGKSDLYIVYWEEKNWSEPVNLGDQINTQEAEYSPVISPDGKYLFFSRRYSTSPRGGWANVTEGEIYWVDASVLRK